MRKYSVFEECSIGRNIQILYPNPTRGGGGGTKKPILYFYAVHFIQNNTKLTPPQTSYDSTIIFG